VFKLIVRNTFRHRLRTALTILGMAVAILSFGLLRTVVDAWHAGVSAAAADRLVTRNAISLIQPLPLAYLNKIKTIPGVVAATYGVWFGGIYLDEKHFFPTFAVQGRTYLDIYPEFIIAEDQKLLFLKERNACVVGRKIAKSYGWKLGDIIPLKGTIYPGKWEFVLRAIYAGVDETTDESRLFFHWDYLNESLVKAGFAQANQVGWYIMKIADPDQAGLVTAQVDATFKNSLAETLTESEKAFQMGFVSMSGAILTAIQVVSYVVIGVILIVLANTMAMTARERQEEHAVLKTLGFRAWHLATLICGESLSIALAGGILGLILIFPAAWLFRTALGNYFRVFHISTTTQILSLLVPLGVGVIAALFPAWQAGRISIAQGLRRIG
jgi:putative ABC transport system permease protein